MGIPLPLVAEPAQSIQGIAPIYIKLKDLGFFNARPNNMVESTMCIKPWPV
jgi:hypothetical protein